MMISGSSGSRELGMKRWRDKVQHGSRVNRVTKGSRFADAPKDARGIDSRGAPSIPLSVLAIVPEAGGAARSTVDAFRGTRGRREVATCLLSKENHRDSVTHLHIYGISIIARVAGRADVPGVVRVKATPQVVSRMVDRAQGRARVSRGWLGRDASSRRGGAGVAEWSGWGGLSGISRGSAREQVGSSEETNSATPSPATPCDLLRSGRSAGCRGTR